MNRAADNPDGQARLAAFRQALQDLGWTDGSNARIDVRWGGNEPVPGPIRRGMGLRIG